MLHDEQKTREQEGGKHGKESCVPELVGIDARQPRRALGQAKRKHETACGYSPKGREGKVAEVKEVGVHRKGKKGYRPAALKRPGAAIGRRRNRPTGPYDEAQVNPSKTVGSSRGSLGFPDWRT